MYNFLVDNIRMPNYLQPLTYVITLVVVLIVSPGQDFTRTRELKLAKEGTDWGPLLIRQ